MSNEAEGMILRKTDGSEEPFTIYRIVSKQDERCVAWKAVYDESAPISVGADVLITQEIPDSAIPMRKERVLSTIDDAIHDVKSFKRSIENER